jgi:hypothetical protein
MCCFIETKNGYIRIVTTIGTFNILISGIVLKKKEFGDFILPGDRKAVLTEDYNIEKEKDKLFIMASFKTGANSLMLKDEEVIHFAAVLASVLLE